MISKVREAGLIVTCDWTQAEGNVCSCGHRKIVHRNSRDGCTGCICLWFNGVGPASDSSLSDADRRKYAQADLDGVLSADVVWLLAANDKGACGSWVELGAALAARELREQRVGVRTMRIVVSGHKNKRTIFTELADALFETDEEALQYVRELHLATVPG
jgi:hypothetical protein